MSITINSIDLNTIHKGKIRVSLTVDPELQLIIHIEKPSGDQGSWTIDQIKELAIEAAGSKIPRS